MRFVVEKINVPNYNDSFCRFKMAGKEYQLRFSWNDTEQRWYFSIYDAIKNPLFCGMKVVPGIALNQFCGREELYQGAFVAVTNNEVIGRDDFNSNVAQFVYGHWEEDS